MTLLGCESVDQFGAGHADVLCELPSLTDSNDKVLCRTNVLKGGLGGVFRARSFTDERGSNGADIGRSRRTLQLWVKSAMPVFCRGLAPRIAGSEPRTGKETAVWYRSAGDTKSV
jgi:hypothetical protein